MVVVVTPTKNTPSNLASADSTARLQLSRSSSMAQAYHHRLRLSRHFRTSNVRPPNAYLSLSLSARMNVTFSRTRYSTIFPFSIFTFWLLIQAPVRLRSVLSAREMPALIASSKLFFDDA